jgi:DNA-binding CsgD family transcriptional regulator
MTPREVAEQLTPRENSIVHAIAEGKSNKQIAWELQLAENTVKTYCSKLYSKLELSGRVALAQLGQCHQCPTGPDFEVLREHLRKAILTTEQARELVLLLLAH